MIHKLKQYKGFKAIAACGDKEDKRHSFVHAEDWKYVDCEKCLSQKEK